MELRFVSSSFVVATRSDDPQSEWREAVGVGDVLAVHRDVRSPGQDATAIYHLLLCLFPVIFRNGATSSLPLFSSRARGQLTIR